MLFQEDLKGLQPVDQTFCVVETIDAQDDLVLGLNDLLGFGGQFNEAIEWNSDWKRADSNRATAVFNEKILAVDTTAEIALAAVDKVQAVVANVEADHVAAEHALKDFVGPREEAEDVPRRERNVQEERKLELEIFLFCELANVICAKHQVVIVDPHDWNSGIFGGTPL